MAFSIQYGFLLKHYLKGFKKPELWHLHTDATCLEGQGSFARQVDMLSNVEKALLVPQPRVTKIF